MSRSKLDHGSVFGDLLGNIKDLASASEQRSISLEQVVFNPAQPRKHIDDASLATLTASIKNKGVLEPILVRPSGRSFELVAGERRTRAARAAGLETIPAIIREMDDSQAFEVAIIENLQREDLNPVEETDAILRLLSMRLERPTSDVIEGIRSLYDEARGRTGNTRISRTELELIKGIFEALGRFTPGSFYTNRIPILSLPSDLLEAVRKGDLNYPKAKLLSRIKDDDERQKILKQVLTQDLSREEIARLLKSEKEEGRISKNHLLLGSVRKKLTARRLESLDEKEKSRVEKLLQELEKLLE